MSCKTVKEKNKIKPVDSSLFLTNGIDYTIKIFDCTLIDGTETKCYQLTTKGIPSDHKMDPWCTLNITDTSENGLKMVNYMMLML